MFLLYSNPLLVSPHIETPKELLKLPKPYMESLQPHLCPNFPPCHTRSFHFKCTLHFPPAYSDSDLSTWCLLLSASSSLDILHNSLRTWLKCHFVGDALLPQQSPSIPSSCLICLPTTYHHWSYIICLFIVCLLPWEHLLCLLLHFQHSEQCLAL